MSALRAAGAAVPHAPPWRSADPAALRAALHAAGDARALPAPSLRDYVWDLARALEHSFVAWAGQALPWAGVAVAERVLVYTATGAAALVVVLLVVLAVRRYGRGRKVPPSSDARVTAAGAAVAARDAAAWRAELRRRLAAGALRDALQAAWWWAARSLDPPGLDPAWTTGELLRARGASALRQPLRRVDRLLWGAGEPRRDDVDQAVDELGTALGSAGRAPDDAAVDATAPRGPEAPR